MILYLLQCSHKVIKDNAPPINISRTFTCGSVLPAGLLHYSVLIYFYFVCVYQKQASIAGFSRLSALASTSALEVRGILLFKLV